MSRSSLRTSSFALTPSFWYVFWNQLLRESLYAWGLVETQITDGDLNFLKGTSAKNPCSTGRGSAHLTTLRLLKSYRPLSNPFLPFSDHLSSWPLSFVGDCRSGFGCASWSSLHSWWSSWSFPEKPPIWWWNHPGVPSQWKRILSHHPLRFAYRQLRFIPWISILRVILRPWRHLLTSTAVC
jgi:hypothetical protein